MNPNTINVDISLREIVALNKHHNNGNIECWEDSTCFIKHPNN